MAVVAGTALIFVIEVFDLWLIAKPAFLSMVAMMKRIPAIQTAAHSHNSSPVHLKIVSAPKVRKVKGDRIGDQHRIRCR